MATPAEGITDIAVTWDSVPPSPDLARWAKFGDTCLWAARTAGKECITEVKLRLDDGTEEGWTKLATSLVNVADKKVFLHYRKIIDASPIVELKTVENDKNPGAGFVKLTDDINLYPLAAGQKDKDKIFIAYITASAKKKVADAEPEFDVGQNVDCLDTVHKWCEARIVDVRPKEVYVHYVGWADTWNEWLPKKSNRLAPYRSHTEGTTGPSGNMSAFLLKGDELIKFRDTCKKTDALYQKIKPKAEAEAKGVDLSTEFSKEELTFLTTENFAAVTNSLNAVVDEPEVFPEVIKFWEQNLLLATFSLNNDADARIPLFAIIGKILNSDENERFYIKYGVTGDETFGAQKWAIRPKSTKLTDNAKPSVLSSYHINIINYFGDIKGFEALAFRLTKREDSFPALAILIKALHGIRTTLILDWAKDWIADLNLDTLVQSRVKKITDDELKSLNRNAFQNTAREVSALLALADDKSKKKDEFMERLNLDIALRLMMCQVLEKRINGITELVDTVKKVQAKENELNSPPVTQQGQQPGQQGQQGQQVRLPETAKYLTSEYVIEWIQKNNLVASMLGPESHEQVVKRSPAILKFLAKHNALTGKHIDELWQSTIGKHEGQVRIVYECMADLAQELSVEQLTGLYKRIEQTAPSDYTDYFLQFVKAFTVNAFRAGKDEFYGINLFWQLIQDEVKISDELSHLSHTILKELLEKSVFDSQRAVYLTKCLANLKEDKSVIPSLLLAKAIIELYPVKERDGRASVEMVIMHLEKNGLVSLLLSGFLRYQARAVQAAKGMKNVTSETVLVGRHSHQSQRSTRLEFLEYILGHSAIALSQAQVDDLWKAFVLQAVTPDDKAKFLKWLDRAVAETAQSAPAFSQDVARYVFTGLLCKADKMDFVNVSPEGFMAFETYFCAVNHWSECLSSSDRKQLRVLNYHNLIGMDSLWAIAGQAIDPTAAQGARDFVISLHIYVDDKLDKKEMYKSFVDKTMAALQTLREKAVKGDATAIQLANRLVELLDNFLEQCKSRSTFRVTAPGGAGGPSGNGGQGGGRDTGLEGEMRSMSLRDRDPRLGAYMNMDRGSNPISTLGENDFSDDEMNTEGDGVQLQDMRRTGGANGDYTGMGSEGGYNNGGGRSTDPRDARPIGPEPPQEKDDRDEKDEKRGVEDLSGDAGYPKLILANEKSYFDLLFTMLQTGGDLSLKVWNLLSVLPVNKELSDDIKAVAAKSPVWDQLLPDNPMKLLYALQIVEENLQPQDDSKKPEAVEFQNSFISKGGFLRLYILLQKTDQKAAFSEQLRQQCLTLILKLLSQLFLAFLDDASQKADSIIKYEDLAQRLMGLIHSAVHSKITGMKEEKKAPPKERAGGQRMGYGSSYASMYGEPDREEQTRREEKETKDGEATKRETKVNTRDIGDLVWNASSLLVSCSLRKPACLDVIYKFGQWEDLIVTGLLNNQVKKLRENLAEGLFRWCAGFDKITVTKPPRAHLLPLLLKCLPYIDTRSAHCTQYFDLIQRLLRDTHAESLVDPEVLSKNMSEKIRSHPFIERRASDTDSVLIGLFGLTKELVAQFPALKEKLGSKEHNLIQEVFNCLFEVPITTMKGSTSNAPPKCKSVLARRSAFALLGELAKGCRPNFQLLLQLLTPNHLISHSNGAHPEDWSFESKTEEKSDAGYVGMRNLGCICYMNSLVQQIFMIPKLRQDILAIDLENKQDKEEDPIYQFQSIMGVLQESEKQYCDPTGFCKSFKDWDGHPINVSIQEDSAGFLNKLIDKFSEKLKGQPGADVFKKNIGGYFANELFGRGECKHYRESQEEFFALQVEIKNKKNVEEALKALVKGEIISDYRCSDCNKKVEVLKRACIKTLPETVPIVLKRFALDYETMQTTKLNDKLEFPHFLDLKQYSKGNLPKEDGVPEAPKAAAASSDGKDNADGKNAKKEEDTHPDEYYKYELMGAIVHTGTATGGHYYSYIRERLTDDMIEKGVEPQWFEFNDKIVRPFEAKDIPEECFGGSEEWAPRGWTYSGMIGPMNRDAMMSSSSSRMETSRPIMREKSHNAYVLFYDRVRPKPAPKDGKKAIPAPAPTPAPAAASPAAGKKGAAAATAAAPAPAAAAAAVVPASAAADLSRPELNRQSSAKAAVPPQLFKQIWQQNTTYWRDRAVFDVQYFVFLWNLISDSNTVLKAGPADKDELSLKIIEFSTRFVFQTLSRAYAKNSLPKWADYLRKAYSENTRAGMWLIDAMSSDTNWNQDFLLVCMAPEVRKSVASLVCKVLETVSALEQNQLAIPPLTFKDAKEGKAPVMDVAKRGYAGKYMDNLVSLLKVAPIHWRKFDQYFRVLSFFAELGPREAGYLLGHNLLARLVDFYLGDDSPVKDVGDLPVDSKGRRHPMGGDTATPDITYFLQLLRSLVIASDTEAIRAGKPLPPTLLKKDDKFIKPIPLSESAQRLLLGKEFLSRLLVEGPLSRKRGQHVSAIVNHHAWENANFSRLVINTVMTVIEESNFDEVRPIFRVFTGLLSIQDSIRTDRIDWSLSSLLSTMKQQEKFWKITDLCIEHLIRLAKKNADVLAWMRSHVDRWAWLLEWVNAFPQQPGHMEQTIALFKPNKGSHNMWRGYGNQSGLSGKRKLAVLQLIREAGKEVDKADASDSDEDLSERVFTVGQFVDAKDTANKWLISKVLEVKEGAVYIHYEGWSNKWDEWMDTDSVRIAKLYRFALPPAQPIEGLPLHPSQEGQAQTALVATAPEGDPNSTAVTVHGAADP